MPRYARSPRPLSSTRPLRICTLAGAILCSAHALADDIQWGNTNGGSFQIGTNWIGGSIPVAGDFARFGRTRPGNPQVTYTVSFSANPANQGVVVEDDAVTFDLNGHAYSLTHPSQALSVGTSASFTGRLTLTDGVVATAPDSLLLIGAASNAPGVLSLTTGAQLLGPSVHVGSTGPGTLLVQNGADLLGGPMYVGSQFAAGITGSATVTGAGSSIVAEDLTIGGIGNGTLNINSGGRVESTNGTLGQGSAVVGTVNVDGLNSRWASSGSLVVGDSGRGTLNINGGQVQCSDAWAGFGTGASNTIIVNGLFSDLIVDNAINVGFRGSSTMNITNGGRVECNSTAISVAAPGAVNVQGGSLLICSGGLIVGHGANSATLNVTDGGAALSVAGFIGRVSGPGAAVVSGPGSRWNIDDTLSVGGDHITHNRGGAALLAIRDGGRVTVAGNLFLFPAGVVELRDGSLELFGIEPMGGPGGQFQFLGGILRVQSIGFDVVNQGGTLAPGRNNADCSIRGNYTQQAGTLEIEIRDIDPTQYDAVFVDGHATLGGTLDVVALNGHVPPVNHTYVVVEANDPISGAFANVANGERLRINIGTIEVNYGPASRFEPNRVVLTHFQFCPSDFNQDGFIDFFDIQSFITCFEGDGCPPGQNADFNSDGFADFFDVNDFIDAFESGC